MWEDELFDEIQKGDKVYYENEQGQTCKGRVAVYMPEPVFAHGSLYVALSRVTNPENLRVCLPEGEHLPAGARASALGGGAVTVNVTFREVLDDGDTLS